MATTKFGVIGAAATLVLGGMVVAAPSAQAVPIGLCSATVKIGDTTTIYHYGHYDTVKFVDWWDTRGHVDRHTHVWQNRTHPTSAAIHQDCGIPGGHPAHPQRN